MAKSIIGIRLKAMVSNISSSVQRTPLISSATSHASRRAIKILTVRNYKQVSKIDQELENQDPNAV